MFKIRKSTDGTSCKFIIPKNCKALDIYTSTELNNIAKSIFDGHYNGISTLIINSIKNAASIFLSLELWSAEKPLPSNTKKQLKKLDKSVSNLLHAFVLDEPAMDWLQFHADELTEDSDYLDIVRKTLENFALITSSSARSFNAHSNPNEEKKIFLEMLAEIWKSVHGERPQHKQIRGADEYDQPFYHFVIAVCAPFSEDKKITRRSIKTHLQKYR